MSKAAHYEPATKSPHNATKEVSAPAAKPYDDFPKDTLKTMPEAPAKTWQWNGSNHHEHPEWLVEHNVTTHEHILKLDAPQGTISAHKGEWIVKDAKGNVHVTSAHPSAASRPSSHLAPETSA